MKNIEQKSIFLSSYKSIRSMIICASILLLPLHTFAAAGWFCPVGYVKTICTKDSKGVITGCTCIRGTYNYTYTGTIVPPFSIDGISHQVILVAAAYYQNNSPFIYLHNLPETKVSIAIDSKLNTYSPKPLFNQKNGWVIEPKNGKITVLGKERENLFYELAIVSINLNRNGRNFSSKEEVVSYLKNSNFFNKLGFSEIEKKNSLGYFIPKIQSAEKKSYYYLTVLDESAIENISHLNLNPKPKNLARVFFALYPTDVPVKTEGDFVYPKIVKNNDKDFSAKETGEILVYPEMLVFWNKSNKR